MKKIDKNIFAQILEISNDFKKRRLNLNLSQIKLSNLSNLSQSIINKFENGKIDPTLSTIIKIENALSKQETLSNYCAEQIMVKDVFIIDINSKISKVMQIMLDKDYSQVLVSKNKKVIGVLYEHKILELISNKIDIYNVSVENYIKELPIIVPLNYSVSDLSYIFQNKKTKFILVGNLNEIVGIITKFDLFKIK